MGNDIEPEATFGGGGGAFEGYAHFRVVDEIARGGMGVVLRGHDVAMGRDVAIKRLQEEFAEDPMIVQRFIEEAQIGGQLQHPGIIPVYELGRTADGRPFFAMKLVKGRTLSEEIAGAREEGPSGLVRLISIFESVAQATAYAHSRRVIHRDLKPSNVMLGAFGEVLLVDWGLAKILGRPAPDAAEEERRSADVSVIAIVNEDTDSAYRSSTGSVMGTIAYMSPEQACGEVEELDERTDVFALGAILCEILTGKPPYPRDKMRALAMAQSGNLSRAEAALAKCDADESLVSLARECLQPEREDRPENAGVVAERVGAWLRAGEERVQAARVEAAEARVRATGERRARRLTLGLAASILFAVVLAAGFQFRAHAERAERERQTELAVGRHLNAASFARGRSEWDDARTAIRLARAQLEGGEGGEELGARIDDEEGAVDRDFRADQERRERAARRERFRREVELVRLRVTDSNATKLASYPRVMKDFGVDMDLPEAEIAALIRDGDLAPEMANLLVDWARLQRITDPGAEGQVERLLSLALAVDSDPGRTQLRHAILADDVEELLALAAVEPTDTLDPMTVIVLADELWFRGEHDVAVDLLQDAELRRPDDFHLQVKLAARSLGMSDHATAAEHLKAALALQPESAWVRTTLGFLYLLQDDVERGLYSCRRAVESAPDEPYSQHYYGVALEESGDLEAAIAAYEKAVELQPEYVLVMRRLGYALSAVGRHAEALAVFLHAAEVEPENHGVLNSVAWRLVTIPDESLRDPDRALEYAERAVALLPRDPDYTSTYGACLYYAGLLEDSIVENERALAFSEGYDRDPAELFYLAMAHARLGNAASARSWLERGEAYLSASEEPTGEMLRIQDEARRVLGEVGVGGD